MNTIFFYLPFSKIIGVFTMRPVVVTFTSATPLPLYSRASAPSSFDIFIIYNPQHFMQNLFGQSYLRSTLW